LNLLHRVRFGPVAAWKLLHVIGGVGYDAIAGSAERLMPGRAGPVMVSTPARVAFGAAYFRHAPRGGHGSQGHILLFRP
jgi:hypothetical protein